MHYSLVRSSIARHKGHFFHQAIRLFKRWTFVFTHIYTVHMNLYTIYTHITITNIFPFDWDMYIFSCILCYIVSTVVLLFLISTTGFIIAFISLHLHMLLWQKYNVCNNNKHKCLFAANTVISLWNICQVDARPKWQGTLSVVHGSQNHCNLWN